MDIHSKKIELVKLILDTDNINILSQVKKFLIGDTKEDFWDSLTKEQKEDVFLGIKDIEGGNIIEYDEFIKNHQ